MKDHKQSTFGRTMSGTTAIRIVIASEADITAGIAIPDMKTKIPATEPTEPCQPATPPPLPARRQPVNPSTFGSGEKETVLLVDDEPLVRRVMVHVLRQVGYRVLEASGAREARRLAATHGNLDLLVTDFSMPQTNGLELARWFEANRPETKVLIATGSPWEFLHQAGQYEPFAVLAKPFNGFQLREMVRCLLDEPQNARLAAMSE